MSKPAIVAVDDDAQVLAAVRRDLRAHYADEYRIVTAEGGPQGLDAVEELHRRGDDVALFLVDQRMPTLTGTDLLLKTIAHYPDAKKVLLTAYADTEAAIRSINEVGLDHYLMKPWDPPEDILYPVLDDLLSDWTANRPAAFDGIRVVGARWSPGTHDVKDFLARNQVPYRFLDVERDPEARTLLDTLDQPEPGLPVVFFPDGSTLTAPDPRMIAEKAGFRVHAAAPFYDLVIIGAGPAGLAAAVYGASEGLRVAVVEREATGGQAGTSARIENYLGFPNGISGSDLARRAAAQATRLGAEILTTAEAESVRVEGPTRIVKLTDGSDVCCHTMLVASGMKVRRLDVPGAERLTGAGLYYGATLAEGASYQGERVVIVGGGNSAGQAAVMFARFAEAVTLVIRGQSMAETMSTYLIDQIEAQPNIEVLVRSEVVEVIGETHLEGVVLLDASADAKVERDATGLFVFIGALPYTDFLAGVIDMDEHGFILTGPDITGDGTRPKRWPLDRDPFLLETSVPGVFAAGDVRQGAVRRVASAVGQGASCVSFVHQYLASS